MWSGSVYAYLDPGTGSVVIQSIIAFFVGALYFGKIYWIRVTSFFRGFLNKYKK
jgi:uncharacterized membrane protein YdcZ (DUF606 family)